MRRDAARNQVWLGILHFTRFPAEVCAPDIGMPQGRK